MRNKVLLTVLALLVIGAGAAFGQLTASHDIVVTINQVALIALENENDVTFTIGATAAGEPLTVSAPVERALYYTVLASADYQITAQVSAPAPAGTSVTIDADTFAASNGTGQTITIDEATVAGPGGEQALITGIPSTATGTIPASSPSLTYTLNIVDLADLVASTTTIVLTLTLGPQ